MIYRLIIDGNSVYEIEEESELELSSEIEEDTKNEKEKGG